MTQAEKIHLAALGGWEGLNESDVHPAPLRTEQHEMDRAYHRVFTTEEGRQVLAHLSKMTLGQPTWVPGAEASYGYAREGQNSIVRDIELRIKRGGSYE